MNTYWWKWKKWDSTVWKLRYEEKYKGTFTIKIRYNFKIKIIRWNNLVEILIKGQNEQEYDEECKKASCSKAYEREWPTNTTLLGW